MSSRFHRPRQATSNSRSGCEPERLRYWAACKAESCCSTFGPSFPSRKQNWSQQYGKQPAVDSAQGFSKVFASNFTPALKSLSFNSILSLPSTIFTLPTYLIPSTVLKSEKWYSVVSFPPSGVC